VGIYCFQEDLKGHRNSSHSSIISKRTQAKYQEALNKMETNPKCLCGVPAKSNKSKTGEVWFRCGKKIDFAVERKKELVHRELGCNLRMSQEMIQELNIGEDGFEFKKDTPKCKYHRLYAKLVRVNDPEKENYGRWFYVCNAAPPDGTCSLFQWKEEEESESEDDAPPPPPTKKAKTSHQNKNSAKKGKSVKKSR